ncbi:quinone oxidoreductase family protein [Novosphingobium sp. Leaf2]|uniref:quinone oxidoreductase family protein n=1 Tax=Novosphingobium sp. Leaf2 TaxID=1735670 RepID=UPI0006F2893E|nr:quinone oxidoreductase [Novosphingobium sp. Leaf2]KQM21094.1 quinone oxidoreductase [Novosphingobium sp. Leaf2]
MTTQIWLERTGGPAVLQARNLDRTAPGPGPGPGPGQVWLEHEAIGVNYLDVTQRKGAVPMPLPGGLGLEGAGTIAALGEGVTDFVIGDRVAYALGPLGAYADGRVYPADRLLKLPDDLAARDAAAILFKGLTAHYLITATYPVTKGTVVLLYGVAGAVGQILARWARHLGATVIGVVSRPESIAAGKAAGCAAVLVWGRDDLPEGVRAATGGRKADVVYDAIGRDTFETSLNCLRPRGLMVSFGASSGTPDPVAVDTLNSKGSLYLTRPGLAAHIADIGEYRARAKAVFDAVAAGVIVPNIWRTYPLAEAAQAHADIEGGHSRGAVMLTPRAGRSDPLPD